MSCLDPALDLYPSTSLYPALCLPLEVIAEAPPDDAALYVTRPDGSEVRLAGDEPGLPLADWTVQTTLPGGFATADGHAVLPQHAIADFGKYAGAAFRLAEGTTLFEGRLESTPELSDDRTLGLSLVGHQALLQDVPGLNFLGVDNDLTAWEDPPGDYIDSRAGDGPPGHSVNTRYSMTVSEKALSIRAASDSTVKKEAYGVAWYLPPQGTLIGEVQYAGTQLQGSDSVSEIYGSQAREDDSSPQSASLTLDLAVHSKTFSPACASAYFRDKFSTDQTKDARVLRLVSVSVFGDHGLTRAPIASLPDGLYFSDVLAYLIGLYAPLLGTTDAAGNSTILGSDYAMPSAVWENATLADVLADGIAFEPSRDWAVWEGPTFHYDRRYQMGKVWTVRRSEGARFVNLGETAGPDYNGVWVTYTDGDGKTRSAGPPGSGATTEDASLGDTSPDNPVNASSVLGDRYLAVSLSTANSAQAVAAGQSALSEALRPRFAGEVELPRYAMCEGALLPTSMMRAGDRIVDGDSSAGDEMLLVSTSYQRSAERPQTATVDTPSNRLDAFIARMEGAPRRIHRRRIHRREHRFRARRAQRHRRREHRQQGNQPD